MGRAWDILPPHRPSRSIKHTKSKNKNNASVFFVILLVIFVGIFIVTASKNTPAVPQTPLPVQETSTVPSKEKTAQDLTIKVLNGTGRSEETAAIVSILNEIGYKVAKTENALSLYDQTTIYFEKNQEKFAQEIANNLTKYKAKTQQFSQDSPYDLIIVIGTQ